MSEAQNSLHGYAYRSQGLLSLDELQALAEAVFGASPVHAFAAGPLWLGAITHYASVGGVPLDNGDFGHIFSSRCELRWRREAAGYDLLGLAEDTQAQRLAAAGMRPIASFRANPVPAGAAHLQHGSAERVLYLEYRGELGAVRLVRYSVANERSKA